MTSLPTHELDDAHGFSLIEALVAVGVSVTVLAAMLPVYFQAVTTTLVAHDQSVSSMAASARLEQLRGLAFHFDDLGGGATQRVTDAATDLALAEPGLGGRGLAPSPPGCLLRDTTGYVDYLGPAGHWLGAGDTPPAGTHYVRRWSVTPLPSNPEDGLVLQVLVTPIAAERAGGPRPDDTRRPGDVWLTLVRTRVM